MRNIWKKSLAVAASAILVVPSIANAAENNLDYNSIAASKDAIVKNLAKSEAELKLESYKNNKKSNETLDVDTLIIKYNKSIPRNIHKKAGTQVINSFPALGYDVVYVPKKRKLSDVLKTYKKQAEITSITPSVKYKKFGEVDPKKNKMYHLQILNIDKALKYAGKHQVTVAVIDAGVNYRHPDLSAQVVTPYNAAAPAKSSIPDLHGTHVAGIIAATANNGIGGHGVNPNAKILPIDVFGGQPFANDYIIAQGILHAIEKKVDVINMSLGGPSSSPITADAVQKAIDAGITVVAAAGNEYTDEYSYPAAYPGVISVGNINSKKQLSESSNYGPSVDIVAPGEDIYSSAYTDSKPNTFMELTGTSMASPVIAGTVSLLKSKYPNLTPYEIEYIIENTATDLGENGYDPIFANGLINPVAALQFDIKKLPKYKKLKGNEQINAAKPLKEQGENIEKGKLTAQEESHYYKIPVKNGQHVQTVLDAAKNYDYKMDLYFYPKGSEAKTVEPIKVNRAKAGEQEAYIFSAENEGTLVIGVTDGNGNYSKSGKSTYTFKAEKFAQLIPNSNSIENPIAVRAFPYSSKQEKNEPLTLYNTDNMPDYDYFAFEVTEPTILSTSLDGIPGVNSSLFVSMLNAEETEPILLANAEDNGIGNEKHLSFQAEPGVKYLLSVSNENMLDFDFDMGSLLGEGLGIEGTEEEISFDYNAYPYNLEIEQVQLPQDEDGLPLNMEEQDTADQANKIDELLSEEDDFFSEIQTEAIRKNAIPLTEKEQKGFFQISGDKDYYSINPSEDSIYSLFAQNGSGQQINTTIYEYDSESKMLIPYQGMSSGGGLLDLLGMAGTPSPYVALKKDTQYFIELENITGSISADPYKLSIKKVTNSPEKDLDNNSIENAVAIQQGKVYDNYFIYEGDTDFYYYKHTGKDQIIDLKILEKKLSAQELNKLPKDLLNEHIFSGLLIEDTDGNKKIDNNEIKAAVPFGASIFNLSPGDIEASFKAKKGNGYFIVIESMFSSLNLKPYQVKLVGLKDQLIDEDGKVTNHIPEKPLKLKKINNTKFEGQGYMNAGVPFGDIDHFVLDLNKKSRVSMVLNMESSLDGVLKIFNSKGKLIKGFDQYGANDQELANVELEKGKYYIEVSEAFGKASTSPYKLTVTLK
ncbi:S8 family peptidase [Cytobacillus praedii]|uniref:S8 family peptidase n=1 Tax=Cytobacillus praedii TaxID=1742358 RepID=UPI00070EBB04|nr:S8 family serine peptidase [Cytobacillus praedii]